MRGQGGQAAVRPVAGALSRVLLVGLMATGKSTVAAAVSAATGWPSVDNDALLERATGLTALALSAASGVEALRAAESAVLTEILSLSGSFVAGVAAGVILDPADRARLHDGGHVVWLRSSVPVILARLARSSQGHRPFLAHDARPALEVMAAEREPLYAQVAHQMLDLDVLTPGQAAERIVERLDR